MAKKAINNKKERAPITWEIRSVKEFENSIVFALDVEIAEGRMLTIYNCRIVAGERGNFISFPSRKGKDGKYYGFVFLKLSDEEQEDIIDAVMDKLDD